MNAFNQKISEIGVVPVIKLNHPERDAADLGRALCAGGVPVAEITFRATGADIAIKLMKEANYRADRRCHRGGRRVYCHARLRPGVGPVCPGEEHPHFPRLHYRQRVSPGSQIQSGSDQIFPRRAVGGPCQDQGTLSAFPHVPRDAHRRHQSEKSEGVPVQSGHRGLRRQLYGHGRSDRQPKVGRDHGALQKVQRNCQGSEGLTWN